jgi:hypothetical protein
LTAYDDVVTGAPIADGLDLATFRCGYGDGVCNAYVGPDRDGGPTRFVIDFAIVHLAWPVPDRAARSGDAASGSGQGTVENFAY